MRAKTPFYNRINIRILAILLILLSIAAATVSIVNTNNIRSTYKQNYTERVLLTNAIMTNYVSTDKVKYFIDVMKVKNEDEDFKARQVQFYHDRLEYWDLPEDSQPDPALLQRLTDFCEEMLEIKNQHPVYWEVVTELKNLNKISRSEYLYVMADFELETKDGEKLYTFIFASDDETETDINLDGLGTSDTSLDSILTVYQTKKQMDWVDYYNDIYGELYYAYSPIIDGGEVIAVFGTDLNLTDMNESIARATLLTNIIFLVVFVLIIASLFLFLHLSIITPLKGLTQTAYQLAEGNIYADTPKSALKQRTEIGTLASAINSMSLVYQDMVKSAGSLFSDAKIGKLDVRNDTSKFKGDIQNFMVQTNDTLDATTQFLNSIPESIFIINKNLDIYFRNETFSRCFGDTMGVEIMSKILTTSEKNSNESREKDSVVQSSTREYLSQQLEKALAEAEGDYSTTVLINDCWYSVLFKEIINTGEKSNSILVIAIDITDLVNQKERAQAATKAKSGFLSRMSHEMRTPMNAIIGMAKIAENSNDTSKLKYCLSTINLSATHLLGIINDVLDMSKIEAGKFELDNSPINIEKILMNVCNIVIENMEKKHQKFSVELSKGLELNYIGDGLRLSQVLTNLLSNAVKFTPENGKITLTVLKSKQSGNINTVRFSIADTGIGMTTEQAAKLFNAFEQADGSVSRKYGGTGLGLAISKNIVEKMGGSIWAESVPGSGSTFTFEVKLERTPHQNTVIFDGIRPQNLKILIVESDDDARKRFIDITQNFDIATDAVASAKEAIEKVNSDQGDKYDIIFLSYDLPETDALKVVKRLNDKIDKNTVIIITTFLEWRNIEKDAIENDVSRYITKPFFPSSILDAINEIVGSRLKSLDIKTATIDSRVDFSDIQVLLAEDVEINREIFLALLEDTKIKVDCAENGKIAVSMFEQNPDKYDLIIMDIQMPEMDGFMATRTIRSLDHAKAKSIPIIAMTANAFKEDIDRCIESGMNDHLAKPINEKLVIEKIAWYTKGSKN